MSIVLYSTKLLLGTVKVVFVQKCILQIFKTHAKKSKIYKIKLMLFQCESFKSCTFLKRLQIALSITNIGDYTHTHLLRLKRKIHKN